MWLTRFFQITAEVFPTISRCFSYYGRPTHARSKYSSVWLMSRCWGSTTEASRTSPTRVLVSDHILFLQMITITQMLLADDSNRETPTATRTLRLAISTGADTGFPERGGGGEDIHKRTPIGHCLRDVIHPPKKWPQARIQDFLRGGGGGWRHSHAPPPPLDIARMTSSALPKSDPRRGYRISWGGGGEGIVRVTSSALQKVEKKPHSWPITSTPPWTLSAWRHPPPLLAIPKRTPPPPGRTQEGGCRDMPNKLTSQTSARLS